MDRFTVGSGIPIVNNTDRISRLQEVSSADNVMKNKMNSYTQTKNALQAIQRKQT